MALATVIDLPRFSETQDLKSMRALYPPPGKLCKTLWGISLSPLGIQTNPMETVEETRRARLKILVSQYGGMASLCEKLGYARNETATLTRILNANVRHDRDGKPYNMGSPMARQIETVLNLPVGWMDTSPSYGELHGEDDLRGQVLKAMENMSPSQIYQTIAIMNALQVKTPPDGEAGDPPSFLDVDETTAKVRDMLNIKLSDAAHVTITQRPARPKKFRQPTGERVDVNISAQLQRIADEFTAKIAEATQEFKIKRSTPAEIKH